jgi:hypothetical protein
MTNASGDSPLIPSPEEVAPRALDPEERRAAVLQDVRKDARQKRRFRLPSLQGVDTDRLFNTANFIRLAVIAGLIILAINLAGALGQGPGQIEVENVGQQRLGSGGVYIMVPASWGTRLPEGQFDTPLVAIQRPTEESPFEPSRITVSAVDVTSWFGEQLDANDNPLPTTALLDSFIADFLAEYGEQSSVETVFYSSPDNEALQLEARLISFEPSPLDANMRQQVMVTLPDTPSFRAEDRIFAVLLTFSYDADRAGDEVVELTNIWEDVRQSLSFN